VTLLAVIGSGAFGSTVTSAAFTGASGTVSVGGTLYAKSGGALTLTVITSSDTKCVQITGAHSARQTSSTAKSSWTFSLTAGSGGGIQTVTASASPNFNQNNCTGQSQSPQNAAYVLDNTGPQVTAALAPSANVAGWNKSNVGLTWSATDAGSGVASGPTPATDSVNSNTASITKSSSATDRLGNEGSGSVTIKLDKTDPSVGASRSPQPNANGWNNGAVTVSVTCSDALSGIKSCTGNGTTVVSAEAANQSVEATAVDVADNSASTTVGPINIDKTAPALNGAVTGGTLGDHGWYTSNVTIHWTGSDALSGIDPATAPADNAIAGEGQALKATASVRDRAGNQTVAESPTVKIDKTAPNTDATAVDAWNNVDVTVELAANDALSGVATTHYRVDGGGVQAGTQVSLSAEGVHSLEYWSVDQAGNAESHKSVDVRIDKSSPTIAHQLTPDANANGWFKNDVDVHFICSDALSGIKSCGPDRVISTEGADRDASGVAVDNAGNNALDPATVSLDRTAPTIKASVDRPANDNGWYADDVIVSFACGDALSGVDSCPGAKTLGEGKDQSASATVADAAGNTAADGVTGIDVDETAPALSGHATTDSANGWYRSNVTVAWTCSDALSGLDGDCPADSTVEGEGSNLSVTASAKDRAGNVANRSVDGVRIDRTAPTTSAELADPLESGWYAGAVKVTLKGLDNLSGVEHTYFSIDGGDKQAYTAPFDFGDKGVHEIAFWSVDEAGNVEDASDAGHSVRVKIDGIAPSIAGHRTPAANAFGWSNGPVTASFECSDAESGVAGCSDPVTLTNEGAGQSVDGSARDNAGNTSEARVDDINIDLTAPELSGAPTTDANAAGWYRGDVTVHWTGHDALSGIDPDTAPADSLIDGEGSALGAGPVSVSDKAGNTQSASIGPIKIDRTPPVISGAPKTQPNVDGWYGGDVVVGFSCTDTLSGVASCPSDKLVSGNGAGQSVTSDPATDVAGNSTEGTTVGGLSIDGLPPQTTADNQCTKSNGWCTGVSATVVLTAADQPGLSGVNEIHYRVNGAEEQVAVGASKSVTVPLDGSGEASVVFYAVDKAGNAEAQNGVSLKYDNIAPMVTHTLAPAANADGWNKADVTVHFSARDNDSGSGVDPARTTPDVLVANETAGRTVAGEGYDVAGNRGIDSAMVRLDKTAPTVSAQLTGQRGDGGWYVGPVTVHFTCSDDLSNVAVCPDDIILTANGSAQSASGEARDFAGNKATATVSGIDIDRQTPTIALRGIADGAIYTLGAVPDASCSANDDVSGPASCSVSVSGGQANGVGLFSYKATANDNAGNTETRTGSYRVVYRFDGFLQPINDTAHQVGVSTSIFKAGSTVPVKLQLKRADGTAVQAASAPVWEVPVKGSPTTAPVDESVYGTAADSTNTYRFDGTARQYIYNWGTDAAGKGSYHRIGVKLEDGQTYFVNIGLR
jgi:hypothetical protein